MTVSRRVFAWKGRGGLHGCQLYQGGRKARAWCVTEQWVLRLGKAHAPGASRRAI